MISGITEVPQILVESTSAEPGEELTVPRNPHKQDGWLSVPDITASIGAPLLDDQTNGSAHLLDEHSPQPWLGTLFITVVSGKPERKPIHHEPVWVQVYRKYPSVGSRIGLRNTESQSYALFFPATFGGKCVTRTSPNPCVTPLLCLNLRHATVVPQDAKRFSVITRSGDCCSLQAEVADDGDLDYWLEIFRQNIKGQTFPAFPSAKNGRMVRSAPNSPERKCRLVCPNGFALETRLRIHDSTEPLNDIVEDEDDE
ncbi:unnamed protein product [Echinostoma caproni]|uniref:PH domain-containing protein n=1 Tax=Echinostoma caproni TaxID=27848 RepID=A0A183ANX4_9TREM|nr:unnamed protein product [Echinostoma caproni]